MDPKPHILVVDDDRKLRELLTQYLREQGFSVTDATGAEDARRKMALFVFDLLVLDIMMPKETGLELAKSFGGEHPPILFLTAMTQADDRVKGLEAGADDYLVKPFDPRELVLRIQAILRRSQTKATLPSIVRFGDFQFEMSSARLMRSGEPIALTTGESQLLRALAEKSPAPVARIDLAVTLGGASVSERNVDVQITRLRKKIEPDTSRPLYIQTIRGEGYALYVDY